MSHVAENTSLLHHNVSAQFFHEIKEYQHWMPVELTRAQDLAQCTPGASADKDDACRILVELKVGHVHSRCMAVVFICITFYIT